MHNKLVSIIIPTYNRADLIGETIQSVIDQSYKNWELIIVDDGSSDNTTQLVSTFDNERINYYKIEHCGILGRVRNIGMRVAKGEYIAFLDSDDIWLPHKLEYQLSLLAKYPNTSFVFGHGEQFGPGSIPPPQLEELFVGSVFLPQLVDERFVVYPSTFLLKKDLLNDVGFIEENLSGGDNDFFFRMAWKYEGVFCGERLVRIRKHLNNISLHRDLAFSHEHIQVLQQFYKDQMLTKKDFIKTCSKQQFKIGIIYLKKRNYRDAASSFFKHNKLKPLNYKGWARLLQSILQLIKVKVLNTN